MWPDSVDEIITSDQVFAFGFTTPANGVIVSPLTNSGIRDRDRGVMSSGNTSVGTWKKLERIRANPRVALAFHTRTHSLTSRPEYVLVQGKASFPWPPPADYVASIAEQFRKFGGFAHDNGRLANWWLRDFLWRVPIDVAIERVVVWPDLRCAGEPTVFGPSLPASSPASQAAPRHGTGPRVDHRRAARRARRQPHALLGWVGADGYPVMVPVGVGEAGTAGISLGAESGLVPPGGRRAGLTAHAFARYTHGQTLRKYTGWLDVSPDGSTITYAPHTEAGYRFPASKALFMAVAGGGTRLGVRRARRSGFLAAAEKTYCLYGNIEGR